MNHSKKIKIGKVLLIVIIDLLITITLITIFDLDSLIGLLAILIVFLFSVFLYFIILELNQNISFYFFINIFVFPVILYLMIVILSTINANSLYQNKIFFINNNKFELDIDLRGANYSIFKITDSGIKRVKEVSRGIVIKRNDSVFLLSPSNHFRLQKNILIGFPNLNDTVTLR